MIKASKKKQEIVVKGNMDNIRDEFTEIIYHYLVHSMCDNETTPLEAIGDVQCCVSSAIDTFHEALEELLEEDE